VSSRAGEWRREKIMGAGGGSWPRKAESEAVEVSIPCYGQLKRGIGFLQRLPG